MRGGGPDAAILPPNPSASSPHARGWSHSQLNRGGGSSVFPACAEVVRALPSAGSWRGSLPRMRGGGPLSISRFTRSRWSSPHARGWSPAQRDRRRCRDVFPACAGVVPAPQPHIWRPSSLPRMRGGGPQMPVRSTTRRMSSPHARGWSHTCKAHNARASVFPACAGVVPWPRSLTRKSYCLPRMRGGGPRQSSGGIQEISSSPHARGWSPPIIRWHPRDLVFPACAGVVPGR